MFHVQITAAPAVSGERDIIAEGSERGGGILTQSQIIPAGLIHLSQSKWMRAILQNIKEKGGLVLEVFSSCRESF